MRCFRALKRRVLGYDETLSIEYLAALQKVLGPSRDWSMSDERSHDKEELFEPDELAFHIVRGRRDPEELLMMEGIFYLKDLAIQLDLDPGKVIRRARQIKRQKKRVYKTMGIAKLWGHWIVRMKVFADHVRRGHFARVSRVEPHWDGNDLLAQDGIYPLTDACRLLPFSVRQLRYHAMQKPDARETMGVWKDKALNMFVVDMKVFGVWVKEIWNDHDGVEA